MAVAAESAVASQHSAYHTRAGVAATPSYLLWGGVCSCVVVILLCVTYIWNDINNPGADDVSLLQTRFVKFSSALPNATATIGGKTKSLPATFMVSVAKKVPVTLRSGGNSKVFEFEFSAGAEMLEQPLSMEMPSSPAQQKTDKASPEKGPTEGD
jgi:hypothetical protein